MLLEKKIDYSRRMKHINKNMGYKTKTANCKLLKGFELQRVIILCGLISMSNIFHYYT